MYNNRLIVEMRNLAVPILLLLLLLLYFITIYDRLIFNIINIKEIKD